MEIKKTIEESYKFWLGMNNVYEEWAKENDLTSNSLMMLNCNIKCIKNFKNLYRQRITQ